MTYIERAKGIPSYTVMCSAYSGVGGGVVGGVGEEGRRGGEVAAGAARTVPIRYPSSHFAALPSLAVT